MNEIEEAVLSELRKYAFLHNLPNPKTVIDVFCPSFPTNSLTYLLADKSQLVGMTPFTFAAEFFKEIKEALGLVKQESRVVRLLKKAGLTNIKKEEKKNV